MDTHSRIQELANYSEIDNSIIKVTQKCQNLQYFNLIKNFHCLFLSGVSIVYVFVLKFPLFILIVGLCGPTDGDPSNDLTHSDGTITNIADVETKPSPDNPEPVANPDRYSASWRYDSFFIAFNIPNIFTPQPLSNTFARVLASFHETYQLCAVTEY